MYLLTVALDLPVATIALTGGKMNLDLRIYSSSKH